MPRQSLHCFVYCNLRMRDRARFFVVNSIVTIRFRHDCSLPMSLLRLSDPDPTAPWHLGNLPR
ncbi:MAG: hypothetical protein AAFX95_26775, partial [Cyanobacteria bacterium J06639_16]